MTTMAKQAPPNQSGGNGRLANPMGRNPLDRITKATLETPVVLLYAAVIVTILTVLYALLGG